MRALRSNPFVAGLVAGSLVMSSTAAVTAPTAGAAPISASVSPWAALTVLSGGAPAAALCGAAAVAAAQATPGCVLPVVDAPPPVAAPPTPVPVPPVEPVGGGLGIDPLLLALGAIALGVGIYFLVKGNDDDEEESPA
jgi:hypothetical protein